MDQTQLREKESLCIQEEAPWCVARCPVHVDVKALLGFVAEGNFDAALTQFRKKIPFPGILSHICDEPCRSECKRAEAGGAIRIRDIERACLDYAKSTAASPPPRLPSTGKKIAVIGAGLSGMTAAYDLARKGHSIVVFEESDAIGGRLLSLPEKQLPRSLLREELSGVEQWEAEIRLGSPGGSADLSEFDAVYLGIGTSQAPIQGLDSTQDHRIAIDQETFFTGVEKIFAGGSAVRSTPSYIGSLSDGRRAAISIDRYLQNVSLTAGREKEGSYATRLYTSMDGIPSLSAEKPTAEETGYTKEGAAAEASRCIRCECLECVKACEYLRHYKSYPKRYVREVYNNLSIVMGMRKSNEFIDSCSLCGLCAEVCPTGLNMAEINREARRIMVSEGKSPPSAFDFALRDLAFSTGPEFFLARGEAGCPENSYLFFPGCQLSATLPSHVEKAYTDLRRELKGGVALILGCCGVPAEWAGRENLASQVAASITAEWERLGRPAIIAGCPTCGKTLAKRLPAAKVEHLIQTLERIGVTGQKAAKDRAEQTLSIHDACTTREDTALHGTIRRVVNAYGYQVSELKTSKLTTECCGYGGLMYNANQTLANAVTTRRISQSEKDFVAYCAMCRDRFITQGKKASHILELIYGPEREAMTFSLRRENRRRLKTRLLREVWGEQIEEQGSSMNISIAPELKETMEARFILLEDIEDVVRHAESTGEKLQEGSEGLFIANHRPGSVTYWVWYEKNGEDILVRRVYSHRMKIIGSTV